MQRFLPLLLLLLLATTASAKKQHPALLDPSLATETAPEQYTVKIKTTKGLITLDVTRAWAPQGADRFYNLVQAGFYDDVGFFRVIARFVAQFGINGNPAVNAVWREATIPDDPVTQSNLAGTVTFATSGPNTRTTQIFINLKDNPRLDEMGFAPFGTLRNDKVAQKLYVGYGEGAPQGRGPDQERLQTEGKAYLEGFGELDHIKRAWIAR